MRRLTGRRTSTAAAAVAATWAAAALAAGCAQQGAPPGGRPDPIAPKVVSVSPDSGATSARPGQVEFRFDEVVAERPARGTSLAQLVLVSPYHGAPEVRWRRNRITVRPDGGFRDNTVYVVQLLPGVADLRGNVRDSVAMTVFSTGATIPATRISGVVFDWVAQRAIPNALVRAITRPDSVVYVARADSSGRFVLPYVPPGTITVQGIGDEDGDFALDEREAWDSTAVTLTDSVRVELYAFVHDTIGPSVRDVALRDSATLRIILDRPLDVRQRVDSGLVALLTADSVPVPLASVMAVRDTARPSPPAAPADTAAARAARADSAAADTTRRLPAPVPSRPPPVTEIDVHAARPLTPGARYVIRLVGARNLLGHARTSDRSFH
ncbi:MAG TPA: Ig-like domain-containing protein, partial [Gemmatimonadaceae bacterium]|nr:Ig-like domain-containing protein [Gemmatimonadaceae bacterium]